MSPSPWFNWEGYIFPCEIREKPKMLQVFEDLFFVDQLLIHFHRKGGKYYCTFMLMTKKKQKKNKAHLHHKAIQSCIKWSKEGPLLIHVKNDSIDFYTRNDTLKNDEWKWMSLFWYQTFHITLFPPFFFSKYKQWLKQKLNTVVVILKIVNLKMVTDYYQSISLNNFSCFNWNVNLKIYHFVSFT